MYSKSISFAAFIMLIFFFCSSCEEKSKNVQWYYWKQDFKLNTQQERLLDTLNTAKIYTKFFDIDKDLGETIPLALIQFDNKPDDIEIVPCIYITNRTLDNSKRNKSSQFNAVPFAKKVYNLVETIIDKNRLADYKEIQFDCDWTASTKDNYFAFLNAFQELTREEVLVTSTLRLHQLKYPKETGVPPVEKVCLMVYNMGDINDPKETNSIFNTNIVKDYVQASTTYPLPMDIALPVYSWAVLYRFEKLSLIISNINQGQLKKNQNLVQEDKNIFRSTSDHYFAGNYIYKDDLIRLEAINADSILPVLSLFKGIKSKQTQLILFELSNENSLNYTYEEFENICTTFY